MTCIVCGSRVTGNHVHVCMCHELDNETNDMTLCCACAVPILAHILQEAGTTREHPNRTETLEVNDDHVVSRANWFLN